MIVNLVRGLLDTTGAPGTLLYRHPEYMNRWWWWEFGRVSYKGGREYHKPSRLSVEFEFPVAGEKNQDGSLSTNPTVKRDDIRSLLFRHNREKSWEYENRRKRSYYYNFPKIIVNSVVSHAMKRSPNRTVDDKLQQFNSGVDYRRQLSIDQFMRRGLRWAQVEGIMWCVMDVDPDDKAGKRPYVYWVNPLDVMDWEVDSNGDLLWIKQFVYAQTPRANWRSPIEPRYRFRIWSRDGVETWETDVTGGGESLVPEMTREYKIGRVPWEPLFATKDEECSFPDGTPLVEDVCKASNNVYNWCSLLSEIVYKQTFSWLVFPVKDLDQVAVGTNTAFGYDASQAGGAKPEYIGPDPEQPRVILEAIGDCISQARQSIGVGRGRAEGSMDQASGDALELESDDKRSILGDIVTEAEDFERRLAGLERAYRTGGSAEPEDKKTFVNYDRDFDERTMKEEVDEALSFRSLSLSPEVNLEMVQQLVRRKFSGMEPKKVEDLVATLKVEQQKRLDAAAKIDAAGNDGADATKRPQAPAAADQKDTAANVKDDAAAAA